MGARSYTHNRRLHIMSIMRKTIIAGLNIEKKIRDIEAVKMHKDDVVKMIKLLEDSPDLSWLDENSHKVVAILKEGIEMLEAEG